MLADNTANLQTNSIINISNTIPNISDSHDYKDVEYLSQTLEGTLLELQVQNSELDIYRIELQRLQDECTKYKEAFESSPTGYFILDSFMQIIEVNPAGASIFGKRLNQVSNTPFAIYIESEDRELVNSHISSALVGQCTKIKTRIQNGTGNYVTVTLSSHPVKVPGKAGVCCHTSMVDINEHTAAEAELRKAKNYLQHAATHDALTKLPNRLYFNDQLGSALVRARRTGKKVATLLLDLDRFKYVNDTLGHHVGDELLIEVAKRLRRAIRDFDTVARLGGDEFTVILEQIECQSEVSEIAEVISKELARPFKSSGYEVCTAASMGVCVYPNDSLNTEEIVRFADAAMYRAKSKGRNNIQFFTTELGAELSRKFSLENDLRVGLKEEQFELLYQPQYDVKNNTIVGIEALLRWNHPSRGQLSPVDFIDVAEESGAIDSMGDWIMLEACKTIQHLHSLGYVDLNISINLSAKQFNKPTLQKNILDTLESTNTSPCHLELELTESSLLEDAGQSIDTITNLYDRGIRISIDDFGTGYSSLSRLRQLPLSRIKIDKSFVFGLPTNQDDRAITKSIISMAHDLGLSVVSEGVETKAQAEFLKELGCDYIQGYLVAKPMTCQDIVSLLETNIKI